MGWTGLGEACPPQGQSWVFLQMKTKQIMMVSSQHIRLRGRQQGWRLVEEELGTTVEQWGPLQAMLATKAGLW